MARYKLTSLVLASVVLVTMLVVPAVALANNGPHGGFSDNTDQCAACHRAHTAPSSVQWTYNGASGSALLIGTATFLPEFCLTCHGTSGQGADTNVLDGVYEGRVPLGGSQGNPGDALISGPFGNPAFKNADGLDLANMSPRDGAGNPTGPGTAVTSKHWYAADGLGNQSWGAWGGGTQASPIGQTALQEYNNPALALWTGNWPFGAGMRGTGDQQIPMDCATCHDVHGTSNYRLLKDKVYSVAVGGYDLLGDPDPYVISAEKGFPQYGFEKGVKYDGSDPSVTTYEPNYTVPRYAKPPDAHDPDPAAAMTLNTDNKGMAGWCVGCHTYYMGKGTYAQPGTNPPSLPTLNVSRATTYAAENLWGSGGNEILGGTWGNVTRYRHPNNVPIENFKGVVPLEYTNAVTPLANDWSEGQGTGNDALAPLDKGDQDYVDCLTCHYAHGTTATMSGYANSAKPTDPWPDTGDGGVQPTTSSALLRADNRTVCQACHNK
jgi:predicted CXXCH cytochrome family protein